MSPKKCGMWWYRCMVWTHHRWLSNNNWLHAVAHSWGWPTDFSIITKLWEGHGHYPWFGGVKQKKTCSTYPHWPQNKMILTYFKYGLDFSWLRPPRVPQSNRFDVHFPFTSRHWVFLDHPVQNCSGGFSSTSSSAHWKGRPSVEKPAVLQGGVEPNLAIYTNGGCSHIFIILQNLGK